MKLRDAIELIRPSGVDALGPTTWADLGCGDGTFTLALAGVLAAGSTIHAMDRDRSALRKIPSVHNAVRITAHQGYYTGAAWPFADLDGILMANSLHYVADQRAFIERCEPRMKRPRRFLIVEYDAREASRWVPHPVSVAQLTTLFGAAGYSSIRILGTRPSVYRRAPLYAALIA
jgi:SAM-dependent methyltransferase